MPIPHDSLGKNDGAKCVERDAARAAQRATGNAAAEAVRSAREQERDMHSEQAHHWRPNRLPRA